MFQKAQLRVLDWLFFFILMMIPFLNAIMIILILLDSKSNPTLKNFIKAQLLMAILIVLFIIAFWSALIALLDGFEGNNPTIALTALF